MKPLSKPAIIDLLAPAPGTDVQSNRRLFLEALRSGLHEQCKGKLGAWTNDTGPVCAVGLYYRTTNRTPWGDDGVTYWRRELGIGNEDATDLTHKNDWEGWTFLQIADWLESKWK